MPLIADDDLETIQLPAEGEWVKVKRRLSRGDRVELRKAILKDASAPIGRTPAGEAPGEMQASLDVGIAMEAAEFALIDIVLREWSFSDPVSPANVRRMDGESVDHLKDALDALYPPERTEDEIHPLSRNGPTPSPGAAVSLAS